MYKDEMTYPFVHLVFVRSSNTKPSKQVNNSPIVVFLDQTNLTYI